MRKIILAALALCATGFSLQSCTGENENHGTSIYNNYRTPQPTELYADQTLDSIYVVSYDSWSATVKPVDGGDWLTATPDACKVPAGYIVSQSVYLRMTPNNTGKVRSAMFLVDSSYPKYGTLQTNIFHYPWLNITVPVPEFKKPEGSDDVEAVFAQKLQATENSALMAFAVFSDATLTSDAEWLSISAEDKAVKPGSYGMKFVVTPNNTSEARVAHVTLTSNGVSNVVTYTQEGRK